MATRLYEGPTAKLMRTKTDIGSSDPDFADPTVALTSLDDYVWGLDGRRRGAAGAGDPLAKLVITITCRKDDGTEVAGTFDAYAFAVLPAGQSGDSATTMRRKVQKLGSVTTQSTALPMVVDVGRHEDFGLRLSNISAALATKAYITVEEWG